MTKKQKYFTCIGKGHGAPAIPATREDWEKRRREPWLKDMCQRIADGDENLKKQLPIWTPGCAEFKNNHRSIADALKPLQRLMLDFDEKGHSAEILERSMRLQEEGKWEILLVEESVRKGTHVLITLPEGMTPQEAQQRFSEDVGFQADPALKDVSRCIYMVPESSTLYVNERLFVPSSALSFRAEQSEAKNLNTPTGASQILRRDAPLDDKTEVVKYAETFKGTPYATIIKEWFRRNGGEPEVGERNSKLHRLASHLRYITDNNEEHLLEILPRYGLKEDEMRTLIHSACTAKFYGMPRALKKLLSELEQEHEQDEEEDNSELITHHSELNTPPPMPKRLPPLIKLLVSKTPKVYQPAVAHAVFPALGAHLWKTYFRYIDNVEHEATLMCCLMAGTGAGKNCISEPINRILKDIRKQDADNLQREKEWKKEMQSKGANKDKRQRPEGLVIQEIDPDMTNAAFVQRLEDAEGRFLYTKMNEIDQFDSLKTSARSNAQFQIMCLAFDPGNVYGQTRVGTSSVSSRVCIRFNWNASTTIRKGQAYFRSVLTDGPVSRINFCTIPEQPIGADMPVYGSYDAEFDEELRPYIERLNKARGLVECNGARNLAKKLREENAEFARLSQSRVYENLSFRANVIAFLKAMVLFVAHGGVWDKTMEDFIRWSLRYDLWCKMRFFGAAIEAIENADLPMATRRGPQNLLDLLPDVFTREEAGIMRKNQGIVDGSLKLMLSNWKKRGYIKIYGEEMPQKDKAREQYVKTETYLKKFASGKG